MIESRILCRIAACVLAMHYAAGFWSTDVFRYLALTLPLVLMTVPLGYRLNRRIHPQHFQRLLYLLLLVLAAMLLWSTLRKPLAVGLFPPLV